MRAFERKNFDPRGEAINRLLTENEKLRQAEKRRLLKNIGLIILAGTGAYFMGFGFVAVFTGGICP